MIAAARRRGYPADPRLQRRRAGRRRPGRGDPEAGQALERRRRLPASRRRPAEPDGPDRRVRATASRSAAGRVARRQAERQDAHGRRPGPARGDPRRRRDRLSAAADALGDRRPGQARAASASSAVAPLPAVGTNLQDHPYVVGIWDSTIGASLADAEKPAALLDFLLRRPRPAHLDRRARRSCSPAPTAATVPPDLQFHLAPAYFADNGFEEYDGHALTHRPGADRPAGARRGHARAQPTRPRSRRSSATT